jgi:hypothetical protein
LAKLKARPVFHSPGALGCPPTDTAIAKRLVYPDAVRRRAGARRGARGRVGIIGLMPTMCFLGLAILALFASREPTRRERA